MNRSENVNPICRDCAADCPGTTEKVWAGCVRREKRETPYERTRRMVYATGNRWAVENWNATHN